MGSFIWATSDVLILIGIFYVTLIVMKTIADNFIIELVIATLVVNLSAPHIAQYFDTPLFRFVDGLGWSYFWPISALSIIAIIAAFIFERSKY